MARRRGGIDGFEIWSSGDRMAGPKKWESHVVQAAEGDDFLELNNAAGKNYQTLGIERAVQTRAGANYTLSLQAAGRIGYGAEKGFSVWVDDVKVATHTPTSTGTVLDWQTFTFNFVGTGGEQKVRIVTDAQHFDPQGRGALIDDIALTEAFARDGGREGDVIELSQFRAGLTDLDGSESMRLTLSELPVGSRISDGTHSALVGEGGAIDVTSWDLTKMALTPPADCHGELWLKLMATTTESTFVDAGSTPQQQASVSQLIAVQIAALPNEPTLRLSAPTSTQSRLTVATDWTGVENFDAANTEFVADSFAGWDLVPAVAGVPSAFAFGHAGDQLLTSDGRLIDVLPSGTGEVTGAWMELGRGPQRSTQTQGIERQFDAILGATYTLAFDYGAIPGLIAASGTVDIWLNDRLIGSFGADGDSTGVQWQQVYLPFVGSGGPQTLRIELSTTTGTAGALLGPLRLVETLPQFKQMVYGFTDTPIALPRIALQDAGDTVELVGLPVGAVLTDGERSVRIGNDYPGHTPLDITGWNREHLRFTAPPTFAGELDLQLQGRRTASNGSTTTIVQNLKVSVLHGIPTETPAGLNPLVTYLNTAKLTTRLAATPVHVSQMRAAADGTVLGLTITPNTTAAAVGSDEWVKAMSLSLLQAMEAALDGQMWDGDDGATMH